MSKTEDERKLKEVKDQLNKRLISLEAAVDVLKSKGQPHEPIIIIFKGKGKKKEGSE